MPVDSRATVVTWCSRRKGDDGFQAGGVGRELADQAGGDVRGEADADPVGAGTDVDAGGVRMLHGQRFDVGRLPLLKGFAPDLRPCFAPVVGFALGLSLRLLAAERRGGGLLSRRGCGHARAPHKRRGEGIAARPFRPCAGESAGERSRLQTGTTRPGRNRRVGVTSDGAETLPGSESPAGKTRTSLCHP